MTELNYSQMYELVYGKLDKEEKKCLHNILINEIYEQNDKEECEKENKEHTNSNEETCMDVSEFLFTNNDKHSFYQEKEGFSELFEEFQNEINKQVCEDFYEHSIKENTNFKSGVKQVDLRSFMNFTPLFIKIYDENKRNQSSTVPNELHRDDDSDDAIYSSRNFKNRKTGKLSRPKKGTRSDEENESEEDRNAAFSKPNPYSNGKDILVRRANDNIPEAIEAMHKMKDSRKNKNSVKNNRTNGYSQDEKKKKSKHKEDNSVNEYSEIPEPYWSLVDGGMEVNLVKYALSMKMDANEKIVESDIIGLDNIKKIVRGKIVNVILRPDLFTGLNRAAKGILLFGPPGTGKTMIAKWIASSCECAFYNVNTSSLFSKYIGETEKIVTSLFKCAEIDNPSILFFDEIDSLMGARKKDEDDTTIRIKNQLLQMIDGISTKKEVMIVIIGATNRPDMIDDAALRRFNKRVYIPLPNFETRKEQIRHIISKYTHSGFQLTDDELSTISSELENWNGSDIYHLCSKCYEYVYEDAIEQFNGIENIPNNYSFRAIQYSDFIKAMKQVNTSYKNVFDYDAWSQMHSSL